MHPRVVIVGGGIAGLAAAHRLATQGVERISLLESSKELGGWMQSLLLCDEKGAEHVVEFGPRSVRDFGATLALAHHAGLADDVLCVPKGLSRMVKLEPNRPLFDVTGIKAMFQSDPSKAAALALEAAGSILRGPKPIDDSTTLDAFMRSLFGPVAASLASAMMHGIYAGDSKGLSLRACMPALEAMYDGGRTRFPDFNASPPLIPTPRIDTPNQFGSISDRASAWTLKGGLGRLPVELGRSLRDRGVDISLETEAASISSHAAGVCVLTTSGKAFEADHVILAIPPPTISSLLRPAEEAAANKLQENEEHGADVHVVTMLANRAFMRDGTFGALYSSAATTDALGVIYYDNIINRKVKEDENACISVLFGGHLYENGTVLDEAGHLQRALEVVRECAPNPDKVKNMPVHTFHYRANKACIPQYAPGHTERQGKWMQALGGVHGGRLQYCGGAWQGVSIESCVKSALRAADAVIGKHRM